MQFKCKLSMPTIDFQDSKAIIQMKVHQGDYLSFYDEANKDAFYAVEIKRWHEKRSLNANALFHVLVGQIAKKHNPPLSFDRCKNILIGRYGFPEMIDGKPVTLKTQVDPELMIERSDIHCKLLRGGDSKTFFYWIMKHTADLNTAEFSKLLDGTIEDAKELGIDLVSENQKRKALEVWGLMIGEKHEV